MGLWFPHIQNQISFKNETVDQTVCEIMDDSFRFTKYDLAANMVFYHETKRICEFGETNHIFIGL